MKLTRCSSPLFPLRQGLLWGFALVALPGGIMIWTAHTLRSQRTTFIPHRIATSLVTTGPFRFSRHPIYLAELVLLLAAGFLIGSS